MSSMRQFSAALRRNFTLYTFGFVFFSILMGLMEAMGVFRSVIGYLFLGASIIVYAVIGWYCRTNDPDDFFVAGRKVPAIYNGMATAADWMSAASFIGMAGTLYTQGFDGLAYIMGWTGGYVLIALLLAPYLRQLNCYTIPDFFGNRFGGNSVRLMAVLATVLCSFVYVIAQIYGVGLIASRVTGADFSVGVIVGLAGIILCSFMGGMKAVTWTQVAQYIVMIAAYTIPASMLAYKHTGVPIAPLMYGGVMEKLGEREVALTNDSAEISARNSMKAISAASKVELEKMKLGDEQARQVYAKAKQDLQDFVVAAKATEDETVIEAANARMKAFPKSEADYKAKLEGEVGLAARAVPPKPHAVPYQGKTDEAKFNAKLNFMALVFCLMLGTAALPHILVRYMTTPTVREARQSVFWSLFFILLIYVTAPALAVMVKYDVYANLVGTKFSELPFWVSAWSKVDSTLLNIVDFNKDGLIQLAEISIGPDLIVLATPEIAGLPFVISCLIAVGGFAAALSTADGLLMAVATAVSHDTYHKIIDRKASNTRIAQITKICLLAVATVAAIVTLSKPGSILFLVAAAFSLAAASIFPGLFLGIFWRRANKIGVLSGMIVGMGVTMYYMLRTYKFFIDMGVPQMDLWYGIQPVGSGVFGVAAGLLTIIVVSLATPRPAKSEIRVMEDLRYPHAEEEDAY